VLRVAIDAQLARGSATGIGEYLAGLIPALRARRDFEIVALDAPELDPWRFDRRFLWDQVLLPLAARRARADLLHCAAGTLPALLPAPAVATVHDVAWLRVQRHARLYARAYFGAFQLTRYRRARRIAVDSAFSRDELLSLGGFEPERVSVVYPGVAGDIASLARKPEARPFALAVGTVERRKNLAVAIRALAHVPDLRLVAVGPATRYLEDCGRIAREAGVAERVDFRGYVPRTGLLELYAGAAVVVVPSLYEGFGYAAAQALCGGIPLLAARTSSLPEVVGSDAPLLEPDDVEEWSHALHDLLADRDAAESRAQAARASAIARFSWSSSAAAVAEMYRAALESVD
jgi:glycosyltransferase involved in cell wall biosynthesis